ncbi:hypothetical protein [Bremerella cremea]|uniref:hypothetical protein n=1 Tax=Bremerella cremea TaxID=1031537 RepID=UPI0031EDBA65
MANYFSIGILIAGIVTITGCFSADGDLEGKWSGPLLISGPVLQTKSGSSQPVIQNAKDAQPSKIGTLTIDFQGNNQLQLAIEPTGLESIRVPTKETVAYEIVEVISDLTVIRMQRKDGWYELELRRTGPDSITLHQIDADPRLQPVKLKRDRPAKS